MRTISYEPLPVYAMDYSIIAYANTIQMLPPFECSRALGVIPVTQVWGTMKPPSMMGGGAKPGRIFLAGS